jgi:predicted secreted protein
MILRATRLALLPVLFTCVQCTWGNTTPQSKHDQAPADATVSASDNGRTLRLKTGDSIMVQLPIQRGTGYAWQPAEATANSLFSIEAQPDTSDTPGRPGAKETQQFRLRVKQSGEADLTFQYRRPWDAKAPPAKTFTVRVEAQP